MNYFKPKVTNKDIVVKWDNLLPSCLRCNRSKNRKEEDMGIKPRFIKKLERNLIECQKDKEYSAIKATNILNHEHYIWIREKLKKENKWTIQLRKLEEELSNLKLDII